MRAVFQPVQEGAINVITSAITITETLTKPLKMGDKRLEQDYREIFDNTQHISLFPVTASVAERAAELRAQYNLKTPDALQVATAIVTNCDAFVTNDLGIKRVKEVRILVLDELELDPP
jgi:predicted nucleic acid-binding protein